MKIFINIIIGMLGMVSSFACPAAAEVGIVNYSRGVLTGQIEGEQPRLIGKGSMLHNGETLNTGSRAFALIEFSDGTKMTLRPSTTFKIDRVDTRPDEENMVLSLIRGGLRAVTGFISKRAKNAFRINTTVATIGIRGTEFDARLCEGGECQDEEDATGATAQDESRVVGRIAFIRGRASAQQDGEDSRVLDVGAAVYERDQIQTGIRSFVVIAFNDDTRATVAPQSAFRIEEHEYKPEQPDENNSFLSFLQGGLRIVTGAIANLNQKAFRVATPTATIGIRGTGFDLVCQGACVSQNGLRDPAGDTLIGKLIDFFMRPAYAQSAGDGMFAKVWRGRILLQYGNQTKPLDLGRTAFMTNSFDEPVIVPDIPPGVQRLLGASTRPDRVEIDPDLFSFVDESAVEPGLYVKVDKGDVSVRGRGGRTLHIGAGEVVRAGIEALVRRKRMPAFQKFDPTPRPGLFNTQTEQMVNLFGLSGADKETMVCTVQ